MKFIQPGHLQPRNYNKIANKNTTYINSKTPVWYNSVVQFSKFEKIQIVLMANVGQTNP